MSFPEWCITWYFELYADNLQVTVISKPRCKSFSPRRQTLSIQSIYRRELRRYTSIKEENMSIKKYPSTVGTFLSRKKARVVPHHCMGLPAPYKFLCKAGAKSHMRGAKGRTEKGKKKAGLSQLSFPPHSHIDKSRTTYLGLQFYTPGSLFVLYPGILFSSVVSIPPPRAFAKPPLPLFGVICQT